MFFPEFLFQLSARDQQVTWLDPSFNSNTDSQLAVLIQPIVFTVPGDRAFVLTAMAMTATPGLAQAVLGMALFLRAPSGTGANRVVTTENFAAVANQSRALTWSGELLIPPNWTVRALASFDAAGAANSVTADALGILIPVGNVQRL